MTAQQKLKQKVDNGLHVCVGLDTDAKKIPRYLHTHKNPILEFNRIIIENTFKQASAYKINFAFYEKDGERGFENIANTLEMIPEDILTIADAKRGDISNTAKMYAQSIFDHFNSDAVTLNPYMGFDSLSPFLEYPDKLNFILSLTSNSGSSDFEKQKLTEGKFLYQKVIEKVNEWNIKNNCGLVFGATNLYELSENISSFNQMPILLPGIGTQGGDLKEIVTVFHKSNNKNFLVNVSRALIYADSSENFGNAVSQTIKDYNSIIASLT